MNINTYLNCTENAIQSKEFNIFIGISLGNKYFSKENIKKYILWALENTKDDVLVLIADRNHAINYEVINSYSPERALQVALRKGAETEKSVKKIVHSLPNEKHHLIKICKWDEARKSTYYQEKIKIFLNEFQNNSKFHDFIIQIIKENLKAKANNLSFEELDKLAMYVLDEIPIMLNGVEFEGKTYDLHPYPGLSSLDDLFMNLQNGKQFPKVAKMLEIKHKIAEVEAYVD